MNEILVPGTSFILNRGRSVASRGQLQRTPIGSLPRDHGAADNTGMRDNSMTADARRRDWSWSAVWWPGGWAFLTQTWLLSLAAHLAVAIVAALVIRAELPRTRSERPALSGDFMASLGEVPRTQYFRDE